MCYFQYYQNDIKNPRPLGTVSIWNFLEAIKKPKNVQIYDEIYNCELNGDLKKKAELKQNLYYIVPPTISNGISRSYKNIVSFTGILHLDFDHLDKPEKFRDELFKTYDFIISAWLSASKKGVKAFVKIPEVDTVNEFKEYFWGLALMEMQQYVGFDIAPQNAVLPLFLSYDKDIKIRKDFTTWTEKGVNPRNINIIEDHNYKIFNPTKYTDAAVKNIEKAVNKITSNGHPQLRGAAYCLGGYVGAGYIGQNEAEYLIISLVKSNQYLSKGTDGYIKTAITMLNKGRSMPVYFDF